MIIAAVAALLVMAYLTFIGIIRPQQAAVWLRWFSLDAAIQTDETKLDRLSKIADKYYQNRDLLAAEKAYLRILKLDHRNFTAYYRLGLIYSFLNNNSDALECFQLASEIKPTATTLHNYGMTLFRYRDYTKAADVLERANAKAPSFARHVTLARIYRMRDDFDKNLTHLQAACLLDKSNVDALLLLADAYLHQQRPDQAQRVFRRVLRLDPGNARARQALAGR